MSSAARLLGLAKKLASSQNDRTTTPGGHSSDSRDWRSLARQALGALGSDDRSRSHPQSSRAGGGSGAAPAATREDRAAIARYDYLLRTADPDRIEAVHRDAFARLTPEQHAQIAARMIVELPPTERPASAKPGGLARAAARAEAAHSGSIRGLLMRAQGSGGGRTVGVAAAGAGAGLAASGLLGAVAGGTVLSAAAGPLLAEAAQLGVDFEGIGAGIDLDSLTGDAIDELNAGGGQVVGQATVVGEQVTGIGGHVSGLGSDLDIDLDLGALRDFPSR